MKREISTEWCTSVWRRMNPAWKYLFLSSESLDWVIHMLFQFLSGETPAARWISKPKYQLILSRQPEWSRLVDIKYPISFSMPVLLLPKPHARCIFHLVLSPQQGRKCLSTSIPLSQEQTFTINVHMGHLGQSWTSHSTIQHMKKSLLSYVVAWSDLSSKRRPNHDPGAQETDLGAASSTACY